MLDDKRINTNLIYFGEVYKNDLKIEIPFVGGWYGTAYNPTVSLKGYMPLYKIGKDAYEDLLTGDIYIAKKLGVYNKPFIREDTLIAFNSIFDINRKLMSKCEFLKIYRNVLLKMNKKNIKRYS